jgi:hypothetical protein
MHLINTPMLASEVSPSSLGGGIEEVIITKLGISPKRSLHNDGEVVDALYLKTRNLNQAIHIPPYDYFHVMPTRPCVIFIKGGA